MAKTTVTLKLNPKLESRLKEAAHRAGLPVSGCVAKELARLLEVCPACGHEGHGVRPLDFDGVRGTCACPPTEDDERWLASLVSQGR